MHRPPRTCIFTREGDETARRSKRTSALESSRAGKEAAIWCGGRRGRSGLSGDGRVVGRVRQGARASRRVQLG